MVGSTYVYPWGPQPDYCSSGASVTALDLPLNTLMHIVTNFDCVMIILVSWCRHGCRNGDASDA